MLLLPNAACLSDAQYEVIKNYMHAGGSVFATYKKHNYQGYSQYFYRFCHNWQISQQKVEDCFVRQLSHRHRSHLKKLLSFAGYFDVTPRYRKLTSRIHYRFRITPNLSKCQSGIVYLIFVDSTMESAKGRSRRVTCDIQLLS